MKKRALPLLLAVLLCPDGLRQLSPAGVVRGQGPQLLLL